MAWVANSSWSSNHYNFSCTYMCLTEVYRWWGLFYTWLTCLVGFILEWHLTETTVRRYTCRPTRTHYLDSEPTKHIYDLPTWVFEIFQDIHYPINLNIRGITNMYAVIIVKVKQFEETKGVIRSNKSKNHKKIIQNKWG
jgi:hypothetical protein